ncbi:LptF/LptG family permease [Salinibius halmophilus]|uniref:LptF/LptG family permease n=1 Tax=Salinibius halmophilus TaxID=1853216 RepID=UPI001314AA75|nr:LptF/LptG family permease [Salinibius halmophilus]
MRIYKYLFREVVGLQLVITFLLLVIFAGTRMTSGLASASGIDAPQLVFTSILFNLPRFALEIIPPSFMIALMLTYARLYAQNEMTAVTSCGGDRSMLYKAALIPAGVTALVVCVLSIYVSPEMRLAGNEFYDQQRRTALEQILTPGAVVQFEGQAIQVDAKENGIFYGITLYTEDGENAEVISAKQAEIVLDGDVDYLLMLDGQMFQVSSDGYVSTYFDRYQILLNDYRETKENFFKAVSSFNLWKQFNWQSGWGNATLMWRLHYPLLLIVIPFFAVPLSRTDSRSGKFAKIIPAIIIYMGLSSVMSSAHRAVAYDGASPWLATGVWIYGLTIALSLAFFERSAILRRLRRYR